MISPASAGLAMRPATTLTRSWSKYSPCTLPRGLMFELMYAELKIGRPDEL